MLNAMNKKIMIPITTKTTENIKEVSFFIFLNSALVETRFFYFVNKVLSHILRQEGISNYLINYISLKPNQRKNTKSGIHKFMLDVSSYIQ